MKARVALGLGWSVVLIFGVIPPLFQAGIPDVAWPLYLAERVLEGARHGVDFFEVNPPLFIWLAIPPVLLHRLTGLDSWPANVLWVVVLATVSVLITSRLLQRCTPVGSKRQWLTLAVGFCVYLLPGPEFGEREHLALIFTIPWVVLCAGRLERFEVPLGLGIAVGVWGAIGFALKPYYLAAWLALEVVLVRGLGKRAFHRSELLALVGTGALYAAIIVLAVPEYIHMAARLAGPYGQYMRNPYWIVLLDAGPALLLVAGVLPSLRAQGAAPDLVRRMFSVAFAGYFLAAVLQHKGFSYHFIPAWGFAYLTLARVAQTLPPVLSWRPSGLTVRAGLILVAAVPAWRIVESSRWHAAGLESPGRPGYGLLLPMLRGLAERGPILVLSSSPAYAWPLVVDAGGSWPLRYMSLWPLPALYDPELTADMPRIVTTRDPGARVGYERRFNDEVLEDILREPPEVIVVQVVDSTIPAWATPQRIDYFGYFNADPRFASVFAQYREAARPRHFILLKRKHD